MKEKINCVLCGITVKESPFGWKEGNNPSPLSTSGRCCNICNGNKVIPARIK